MHQACFGSTDVVALEAVGLIYRGVQPQNGENVSPRSRHVRVLQMLREASSGIR
jgi:hypothetical protein